MPTPLAPLAARMGKELSTGQIAELCGVNPEIWDDLASLICKLSREEDRGRITKTYRERETFWKMPKPKSAAP